MPESCGTKAQTQDSSHARKVLYQLRCTPQSPPVPKRGRKKTNGEKKASIESHPASVQCVTGRTKQNTDPQVGCAEPCVVGFSLDAPLVTHEHDKSDFGNMIPEGKSPSHNANKSGLLGHSCQLNSRICTEIDAGCQWI